MSRKKELRQSKIRQILLEESRVRVIDLAKRLGVTPETLRNDISEMEAQSLLIREHGYARIQNPMQETPLLFRNQENAEAKKTSRHSCFERDPGWFGCLFGFWKYRSARDSCFAG